MKKKIWTSVFVICLLVLILCIAGFGYDFYKEHQSRNELEGYKNTTQTGEQTTEKLVNNPINFDKLEEKNKDIFAWIKVKNTNIDYPIVHPNGKDNTYYLDRNIDGQVDVCGSIFIENYNSTDWSDPVTVVYGHNIYLPESMFYQLHRFENEEFFNQNRYFRIYTRGRALKYEIYSAFQYDSRHILYSFDFSKEDVYQDFIDTTLDPIAFVKNVRKDVKVTTDDKIVVLSTCVGYNPKMRYLVVGVLRKDEKTK